MRVAPAWIELSTSSEIALAVPLYPESRVAWMNLSSAMIEQSARRTECCGLRHSPTRCSFNHAPCSCSCFVRRLNCNATPLIVALNQNFDHVRYGSMFLFRRDAKALLSIQDRSGKSAWRSCLQPSASPGSTANVLQCTALRVGLTTQCRQCVLLLRADRLRTSGTGEAICGSANHLPLRERPSTTENSGKPPVPIVCGTPSLRRSIPPSDDCGTA